MPTILLVPLIQCIFSKSVSLNMHKGKHIYMNTMSKVSDIYYIYIYHIYHIIHIYIYIYIYIYAYYKYIFSVLCTSPFQYNKNLSKHQTKLNTAMINTNLLNLKRTESSKYSLLHKIN